MILYVPTHRPIAFWLTPRAQRPNISIENFAPAGALLAFFCVASLSLVCVLSVYSYSGWAQSTPQSGGILTSCCNVATLI